MISMIHFCHSTSMFLFGYIWCIIVSFSLGVVLLYTSWIVNWFEAFLLLGKWMLNYQSNAIQSYCTWVFLDIKTRWRSDWFGVCCPFRCVKEGLFLKRIKTLNPLTSSIPFFPPKEALRLKRILLFHFVRRYHINSVSACSSSAWKLHDVYTE